MRKIIHIFLSLVIVFGTTVSAYAGLPQSVSDYAVSIKNVVKTGVGVTADFVFKKRAANEPEWAAPAKSVSNAKMAGGFLKRFAKFGIGAVGFYVIEKLLSGTDWLIDEENNKITRINPAPDFVICQTANYKSSNCFPSYSAYASWFQSEYQYDRPNSSNTLVYEYNNFRSLSSSNFDEIKKQFDESVNKRSINFNISWTYDYVRNYGEGDSRNSTKVTDYNTGAYIVEAQGESVPEQITIDELAKYLADANASELEVLLSPQPDVDPAQDPAFNDLYSDPASSAESTKDPEPDPETDPDTGSNPAPEPAPEPDPDTGECPSGYNKVENLCIPDVQPTDFPEFCSWAVPVCEFFSSFDETPPDKSQGETDVVIDDVPDVRDPNEFDVDYIGFSSQCPTLQPFSVGIGAVSSSMTFDMTPLCELAVTIRPAITAIAYFIGLGVIASAIRET